MWVGLGAYVSGYSRGLGCVFVHSPCLCIDPGKKGLMFPVTFENWNCWDEIILLFKEKAHQISVLLSTFVFAYPFQIGELKNYYLFQHESIPSRSKRSAVDHKKSLADDQRVRTTNSIFHVSWFLYNKNNNKRVLKLFSWENTYIFHEAEKRIPKSLTQLFWFNKEPLSVFHISLKYDV